MLAPRHFPAAQQHTLRIRLSGDVFVAAVGIEPEATRMVLRGISSSQDEPHGWNALVLPSLDPMYVSRPDERTFEVQLPQAAG